MRRRALWDVSCKYRTSAHTFKHVSVLMMAGALGLFLWKTAWGNSVDVACTMAVSAIVVAEMLYLLSSRCVAASVVNVQALRNGARCVGQLVMLGAELDKWRAQRAKNPAIFMQC